MASSPQLPPRGSWIFWQSALRNRLSKKTDEGQRYLKVSDFLVEWYNLEHMPLIQLYSSTNRSMPLISQPCRFRRAVKPASFPSGEAKGKKPCAFTIQRTAQSRRLAGGFYPPLQLRRQSRRRVDCSSTPTGRSKNRRLAAANRAHSLSQPVRAASSLREGANGTSCLRADEGTNVSVQSS